jgi:hypothetical protein
MWWAEFWGGLPAVACGADGVFGAGVGVEYDGEFLGGYAGVLGGREGGREGEREGGREGIFDRDSVHTYI